MAHIGILLAGSHYPEVSSDSAAMDGQFRHYLAAIDCAPRRISVYECFSGDIPNEGDCEAWIVSGSPLLWEADAFAYERLLDLVRGEHGAGREVLGLNAGEQVLAEALCHAALPPALPRSVRNPFRSFWVSDVLYRVDCGHLIVVPRPQETRSFLRRLSSQASIQPGLF